MEIIIDNTKTLGLEGLVSEINKEFEIVKERLNRCNIQFAPIELRFCSRLRTTAGTANWHSRLIKLNTKLMIENPHELLPTFVHELMHIITFDCFTDRVEAHGEEWCSMMRRVGYPPEVKHNMKVDHLRPKRQRHKAFCACDTHMLSSQKRNKILDGSSLICTSCEGTLVLEDTPLHKFLQRMIGEMAS